MSGSDGPRGLDRGIAALRWLLVSAQDDPSARVQVLPALSRCTVLVPTMAGAPDKLRYLAQPGGGNAMVVFTAHDALEHAAKKLGWAHGTQSVSFRAMRARDALEIASLQDAEAVIVDLAAEHALELRFDEWSMYLSRGTGEYAPDFVEPEDRDTGEFGLPPRAVRSSPPGKRGTGDYGSARKTNAPAGSSRGTGEFAGGISDLREEVAPRKARDARRDDDGGLRARIDRAMAASEPLSQRIDRALEASDPVADREPPPEERVAPVTPPAREPQSQSVAKRHPSSGSVKAAEARKRNLAEIDDPFVSSTPRRAPGGAADHGGHARRVPSLAAPPLSRDMPSKPFDTSRPPSTPTDAPPPSPLERRMASFNYDRDQTIPLDDISTAEAARDSAARASAERVTTPPVAQDEPSLPMEMFGSADAEPVERPVVAMRPVIAVAAAVEPAAPLPAAPVAPAAVAPAAVAAAPVARPQMAKEPEPEPRSTGTVAKPALAPSEAPAARPAQDDDLSEAVLSAIADELRKFPEAEWACVLLEDDGHAIGVRVDPSYLQRTRDIEAAVANTARKAGALVKPMIVSTPAATKDARSRGQMFFPWKKKK